MMPAARPDPVETTLTKLRDAGCNPRQASERQWTARCPVGDNHRGGDRNPSLSVGIGANGSALIHCHRGCTLPEVAGALGLGVRDLFADRPTQIDGTTRRAIKATYPYYDADGELLYEVVRYTPKGFGQRRPDGAGGWIWKINDTIPPDARPLYHYPQVRAAIARHAMIWVVEGEKDAENLQWHVGDGVTTCNSGGAGAWLPHHAEMLRGANVTVIPDNDDTGRRHAAQVAASLDKIATCRVVAVPDHWKDASEALGAGSEPRLWRHVDDTEWRTWSILEATEATTDAPTADDGPGAMLVDWPEFWRTDVVAEEWIVEPLIPAGRSVAIYAPAKTGKSLVVLSAVAAAATGRSVWGAPPRPPRRILYLDYEMTVADLRERLELLGYDDTVDLSNLSYALIPALPPLDTAEGGAALLELARHCDAEAVIIDTIGRAAQGDENDADTIRAYYRHTGSLLKRAGIASGRVDHAGKDAEKGQRGTSAKNDDIDVVWRVERTQDGVTLRRTHSRMSWVPEIVALDRIEDDEAGTWEFRRAGGQTWPAGTREAAAALDAIGAPVDIGTNQAIKLMREHGKQARTTAIRAAVKWRRREAERAILPVDKPVDNPVDNFGTHPGTHPPTTPPDPPTGPTDKNGPLPAGTHPGTHRDPPSEAMGGGVRISRYGPTPSPTPLNDDWDGLL